MLKHSQGWGFFVQAVKTLARKFWTPGIILKTPMGIDWSEKVLDFYHFGDILDLFRGGNLLKWQMLKHSQGWGFFVQVVKTLARKFWTPGIILKTPMGIDWSQKVLDFYHFGDILDLFRGGNLLSVSTVHVSTPNVPPGYKALLRPNEKMLCFH